MSKSEKPVCVCDFCRKDETEVESMFQKTEALHICSECIEACMGILIAERISKRQAEQGV